MERSGPGTLLAVALLVALVTSGCIAVGGNDDKDKVLASFSRSSGSTQSDQKFFNVGKDVDEVRLLFSTKAAKDNQGSIPGCDWCTWGDDDDANVDGYVRFIVAKPNGDPADSVELHYDGRDESVIADPEPGTWVVGIQYVGGYDGPAALSVTEPNAASANAGGVLFSQAWLDIAGLALAVLTLVGGWWLLRRRSKFLAQELHRIDDAFRTRSEDIEECRENLVEMREALRDMLTERRIEDRQYLILERRIDQYLRDLDEPGNRRAVPKAKTGVEKIRQA